MRPPRTAPVRSNEASIVYGRAAVGADLASSVYDTSTSPAERDLIAAACHRGGRAFRLPYKDRWHEAGAADSHAGRFPRRV